MKDRNTIEIDQPHYPECAECGCQDIEDNGRQEWYCPDCDVFDVEIV